MPAPDLTGAIFGALLVVDRVANKPDGSTRWSCQCVCGEWRVVAGTGLRAGRHKSCGCLSPRFTTSRTLTRGQSQTRTYRIFTGMHRRCVDMTHRKAHLYALKGISVAPEWADFPAFLADMGEAPAGFSIERINGNLGYALGNCRWATPKEQANNTAANRLVIHDGQCRTVSQWAETVGIKPNTLIYRLRRGWPVQRALQTAPQARAK